VISSVLIQLGLAALVAGIVGLWAIFGGFGLVMVGGVLAIATAG
jgi:hypothetical protein